MSLRSSTRRIVSRRRAEIARAKTVHDESSLEEQRGRCETSFVAFCKAAWPHVVKRPLVWGWHNDAMCEHLEAVTHGDIKRLLITVPPGSTKTLTVQVMWPTWEWICNQHPRSEAFPDGHRPDLGYIFASYQAPLARRKSLLCRQLMETPWHRELFGDRWMPNRALWSASMFGNNKGGWRLATSVGGEATGEHPDRQIFDDPTKPQDVLGGTQGNTKVVLENVKTWWTQTMSLRKADESAARIGIAQRIHQADLPGVLIKEGGYEELRIPMHYEKKFHTRTVLRKATDDEPEKVWEDPRKDEGELMCPARFSADECAIRKKDLGPQGFAAQEQQRPTPAGGALYMRHYFKHWVARPREGTWIISGDCTFKNLDTSDYVALQVWCSIAPDFFLIDEIRDRLDVLGTCQAIASLRSKYPRVGATIIEDAANGPAVVQIMSLSVPGMELVPTAGGKYARANATSVYHASGNVYLPPPERFPWVDDYIEEHVSFPVGAHDDRVDAQSHAIVKLSEGMADYSAMLATMKQLGVET